MKVVHAEWERRNLNVDCVEISVQSDDSIETIIQGIQEYSTDYTVVRVPTTKAEITLGVQNLGFQYAETITTCIHTGIKFTTNNIQQRLLKRVTWETMNNDGLDNLLKELLNGIFSTDRIALDPNFGPKIANRRYANWLQDEFEHSAKLFEVRYDKKPMGFFSLKEISNEITFAFLSGTYDAFRNSGLGFACHHEAIRAAIQFGAKKVKTAFSSNNRGAAAVHFSMGHTLAEQQHIFIRHTLPQRLTSKLPRKD
ncbi:GNAT family N-acetyltransferase [Rubripirellula sp.]|nr:GNAT family N-acetyltransferase [Rubripirellula sp.]MDB4644842.1 GNAT family N-acetyltransferase [Rubripirellula sp.]